MKVVKSLEGEWMLDVGPHLVSMSCHHRGSRGRPNSACGGCYARTIRVIEELAEKENNAKALELIRELKEEGAAIKNTKRGTR